MEPYPAPDMIQGKIHHISADEAQEDPEVVIGMFLVNNIPAVILFDSGASHSFISRCFASQNNFTCSILGKHMLVHSAGSLRESWIRGSSDSRTIYFGRTVGL